jgi:hypothetical protein
MNEGMFGTGAPKFVINAGLENQSILLLNHITIKTDEPDTDLIEHKSVITGHRNFINLGKHWSFEIMLYLFKYAYPRNKYQQIKSFEGLTGLLYRHADGAPFKDKNQNNVLFMLTNIDESYLDTVKYKDLLTISFKSLEYIDLSDGSSFNPSIEEIIIKDNLLE